MQTTFQNDGSLRKTRKRGLVFFQFPELATLEGVEHGIFTRHGGCSRGAYRSLNCSHGIGDFDGSVTENRERVAGCFDGAARLVFMDQVHGREVQVLAGRPGTPSSQVFRNAGKGDAMITNVPGRYLAIQIADCQAVMMVDPEKRVVANVHAGWRGNVQNIAGHTLQTMQDRFGSDPADVRVGISPSLGPCCAEFVNYQREFPRACWPYKDDEDRFDLWQMSHDQLCRGGVPAKNIFVAGLCTKCNSDMFFSYRAQKETGRFVAVIGLTASS